MTFDPGPPAKYAALFASVPDYRTAVPPTTSDVFWYAFGPVFYRGRLDGTARVLAIASDPGPVECLPFVRRCLVGDAGQRAQGFLAKLGLAQSYLLVNAFACALHPTHATHGLSILQTNATLKAWRHRFYNQIFADNTLQAIVSFGDESHTAYDVWAASNANVAKVPAWKVAHPSALARAGASPSLLKSWHDAVVGLRAVVTKETTGTLPANYGTAFDDHADYAAVPRGDLGVDAYDYVGWGKSPHNCAVRPSPDDGVSLWLHPPPHHGPKLRYSYTNGTLAHTHDEHGKTVKTNANGIPI